jgi:low temperature requirement protein LtrA
MTIPSRSSVGGSERKTRDVWFELFYDLVVVASVTYGSKVFVSEPSWGMGSWLLLSLVLLMTFWLLTMLSHNLFPREDFVRRLLVLVQMIGLVTASLSLGREQQGLSADVGLAALAVSFASLAAIYLRCWRRESTEAWMARVLALSTGGAAVIMGMGFLAARYGGEAWEPYLVWVLVLGLACGILPLLFIVLNQHTSGTVIDSEHLSERMGQLVLIVLGESFVSLILELNGLTSIPNPLYFVLDFAVVFSIWTIYFTGVLPSGVPRHAWRLRLWILLHCLFMFGAIAAAGGFAALTLLPFGSDPGSEGFWTPLPLLYVMVSLLGLSILGGRHRSARRLDAAVTGILVLLSALALWVLPDQARFLTLIAAGLVVVDAAASAVAVQRRDKADAISR